MKITAKFKIADLEDIFYGDMRKSTTVQWLKPHIPHCILDNGEVKGVFFTPESYYDLHTFTYYLQLVFTKQLLIVNNIYSSSQFTKEVELTRATLDNFYSFSHYFFVNGNNLSGPYQLGEDFSGLNPNYYKNKPIIQAFHQGNIYVIKG